MTLANHPSVKAFRARTAEVSSAPPEKLDAERLRQICLDAGADDVGFIDVDQADIADEARHMRVVMPDATSAISIIVRMNREPLRSVHRSMANLEFHATNDAVNHATRNIVRALEEMGVKAVNASVGFPMEMRNFPGRTWSVQHKTIAVAAGMGQIGIHRNVIHPKFGNFILLGTVILNRAISTAAQPIDYNPCLECKLCVAACPVGAISPAGEFNFGACYTHNYRDFMGGFNQWIDTIADAKSASEYGERYTDAETAGMWQSLSYGPNYNAAYCLAVCPAGDDIIGTYLDDRKGYKQAVVDPLVDFPETIYVTKGSDAEAWVKKRFPNKRAKRIPPSLKVASIQGFINGLPLTFNRTRAKGFKGCFHFTFTGRDAAELTVTIDDGSLEVTPGLHGKPDVAVTIDGRHWVKLMRREKSLMAALLTRRLKTRGNIKLFRKFGSLFG